MERDIAAERRKKRLGRLGKGNNRYMGNETSGRWEKGHQTDREVKYEATNLKTGKKYV